MKLYGIRRRVFFPIERDGGYRLYYGNSLAQSPTYDIQQTFRYLTSQKAADLKLVAEMKNPAFRKPFATKPWLERNPWILWVALLGAVLLMGLLIIRLILQTKEAPPGTS